MLAIVIELQSNRIIRRFAVDGHIEGPSGTNPGCAAASAIFRTFVGLLELSDGVSIDADAPQPGALNLDVCSFDKNIECWYSAICDFLMKGIDDIARDYPEQVSVTYFTI